ncbi:MAG TPA: hypothetical protein VNN62_12280 [Methylomirabilota bacterium]|jgi:hypothetical protein|nr:hypothetical protein [Methylomirabilota bacterium]
MKIRQIVLGATAALGLLWGASGSQAEDGVRRLDRCTELFEEERSSFVLVHNLFSFGLDCLVVNSSNITIDLNGFAIIGNGSGKGISASSSVQGVTIRNGTVRGFAVGISLGGSGNLVEDVHTENNTDTGMFLGAGSVADHVVVQGNWQHGAILSTAGAIRNSSIRANGNTPASVGVSVGPGGAVTGNTIWANTGTGLFGSTGGTVIGNTVMDTIGVGVSVICPANVQQNTVTANSSGNLSLNGDGCLSVNNVAP